MSKVINYIKREYKFFIALFLILFLGLYHLPYNLYVGGGIISLEKRLEVENEYKESGSFNLCYVTSTRATIPSYLLSYIFDWGRESINDVKLDENDSVSDIWEREKLYLQEANDNAIINAYSLAGEDITINKEVLKVLYVDKESDTSLKVGDTIISVDGTNIKDYDELRNILNKHNINDKLDVTYLRNGKEEKGYLIVKEFDSEKKAGIYIIKLYDYELKRKVNVDFNSREGGPSGGFMLSLAIYNRLIKEDLTKGRKIVGTGTIDSKGNVGEIGGVKYKLSGAVRNKADIFFVSEANYEEARKIKEEKGYNIDVVMIKTLSDAVEYLKK